MLLNECSRKKHAGQKRVISLAICALFLIDPIQIASSQTTKDSRRAVPNSDSTKIGPPRNSPAPVPLATDLDKNPPPKSGSTTEGIPAIIVDNLQAQGILGTQVRSSAGEDMGRIIDVIVDKQRRHAGW